MERQVRKRIFEAQFFLREYTLCFGQNDQLNMS